MANSTVRIQKIFGEMLGDEFTKKVLEELGIQNSSHEAQTAILGNLGSNILKRLALEILSVLPKSDHATFEKFIGSSDTEGLRQFLLPRIPNLDQFLMHYANLEYEETKTQMRELNQGVK